MAIALRSHRGRQNLLRRLLLATPQVGALTSSRSQPLTSNGAARCSSPATNPARARECLAVETSSSQGHRQELLWRQFFLDQTLWWDYRQQKKSSRSPDFRHKESHQVLWLNNFYKPAWVDEQLVALDMQMGRRAPTPNSSLSDDSDPQRLAGYESASTPETVGELCQQGQLSEAVEALAVLVQTHCHISKSLFHTVLKKCVAKKDLILGRRVHALTVKSGYASDTFLCNQILRMYASHARLQEAMDVFSLVAKPDAFMWSSIISANVNHGQAKQAIQLYHQMRSSSVKPDGHVFVAALQACASGADLETGQQVHADVLASGVEPDLFVCNCLVDMYAKCGSLADARRIFDSLAIKDVVTWNVMIAGYAQQRMGQEALTLYSNMQQHGLAPPDSFTFVCLLQACASLGIAALQKGKDIHAHVEEQGLPAHVLVGCSLVNMYAKCGSLEDAQSVFDRLRQKDVVTWNAMIAGYAQQGMGLEALHLYDRMNQEGMTVPDSVTFVSLLQACASVGITAIETGKQLHAQIEKQGLQADVAVGCSLVNMYAKCGSLGNAKSVFDRLREKGVVTWTAMIAGYSQQGMGREALSLYNIMQREGISAPDSVTFVCLLQACASVGITAMVKGKELHQQIEERGLQAEVVVGCSLVNMYAKCGSLEDAQRVFDGISQKNVVTWNAMIAGYAQQGMGLEALHLYSRMHQEGMNAPDSVTFVSLLQACASVGSMAMGKGKQFHAQIEERGLQADVVVGCSLVNMYAKCGCLEDAHRVFDLLPVKNVVTWNAMIAGYVQQGMVQEALGLYSAMQQDHISAPDSLTFMCLLQACASVGVAALEKGKQLRTEIELNGLQGDAFVGNSLINMYAKCGSLEDAQSMFDGLPRKDVGTWNALIAGYAQHGMDQEALCLFSKMQQEGISAPDSVTFVCLLQACASLAALQWGKQLHAQIEEQGLQADVFVANCLINMYTKCGSLEDAQRMFDGLHQKDVVTWNILIAGYVQQGMGLEAFSMYKRMHQEGNAVPNSVTFVCLLQACASLGVMAIEKGKQVHAQIEEQGLQGDMVVGCSLVNMYAKCGCLEDAQSVFDLLHEKNVVTWNAMIAGYSQQGMGQEALRLYNRMQQEGISAPDSVTFVCLLHACASVGITAMMEGKQLHSQIEEQGLQADVFVANSLLNMYVKCGSLEVAQSMFDGLCKKDGVTWNSMIAGYAQQGMGQEALSLYSRMHQEGVSAPDSVTFVCLLQACANVAALHVGIELHAQIEKLGLQADVSVANSLISMYGKCGSMVDAQRVFDALPKRDIVAWNALIAGYSRQGDSGVVFDVLQRMRDDCVQPNGITFLSVLTVCSHVGLVNKGREFFEVMSRQYGITPTVEHYTCMVDLLGRAGQVDGALAVVRTMQVQPNDALWHTLLGACRKWGNVEVAKHAFDEAVRLDEKDAAAYVLMSNIYTGAQMWEEAEEIQARRKTKGAWKQPGQSWTDMGGMKHAFVVG